VYDTSCLSTPNLPLAVSPIRPLSHLSLQDFRVLTDRLEKNPSAVAALNPWRRAYVNAHQAFGRCVRRPAESRQRSATGMPARLCRSVAENRNGKRPGWSWRSPKGRSRSSERLWSGTWIGCSSTSRLWGRASQTLLEKRRMEASSPRRSEQNSCESFEDETSRGSTSLFGSEACLPPVSGGTTPSCTPR
jgi:hypothetical protein